MGDAPSGHAGQRAIRTLLVLTVLLLPAASCHAQDEPEYRLEAGAGAGAIAYLGDFNGNILKGMQPWGTLTAKYRMNPRMSLGVAVGYGKLEGSSDQVTTWYPMAERYTFDNRVIDVSVRYEHNFWAYGTGREYRGAKPLVPFIALGLGAVHYGAPDGGTTLSLPVGAGIKWKVAERLNLTVEWQIHFTLSDKLDGLDDPYGIKSSGLFKNTDGYSVVQAALTYDLWAKCKTCNNDRY